MKYVCDDIERCMHHLCVNSDVYLSFAVSAHVLSFLITAMIANINILAL